MLLPSVVFWSSSGAFLGRAADIPLHLIAFTSRRTALKRRLLLSSPIADYCGALEEKNSFSAITWPLEVARAGPRLVLYLYWI